jgi:Flp pilus assembly protein TadG
MRNNPLGRARRVLADSSGNLMIEMAFALPLILLLLIGLFDLGRLGLQKSALLQGARAGAQYGMTAPNETSNINDTAQSATGLTGVTATNNVFCECVSGTPVDCGTTCTGSQTKKTYITVQTTKSFSSVLGLTTVNLGSFAVWTPPTSVSASVTMIVP